DGLVYTVTSKLAQLEQFQDRLSVVPAADVFDQDISNSKTAASQLNVNRVISGSVQRTPDGLRLTVDLIDASSGRVADSRTLDVKTASIAELPRGVVSALTGLLRVDLSSESRDLLMAGQTEVPAAYDFYTRAVGYLQRFEEESNIDAAISLFGLAIKEDSTFALAYAGRGEAYLKKYGSTGETAFVEEAVRDGQQAVSLGEDLPAVRNAVGRIYYTQGNYPLAELEFLRAVTTEPNDAETWRALGNVYRRQDRIDKAEESFRKAVELKPEYWLNHNELGRFYDRLGRHEEAIEPFMQVIALRPTNPWGYNNVGVQYHNLGRLDEALGWYRKATEVNPDAVGPVALALGNMANIHYARDEFERAAELFDRAVTMQPKDEWAWDLLGDSRHWLGDPDGAREAWLEAPNLAEADLEVNPLDGGMLSFAAHVQAKLGRRRDARETLRRLQAVDRLDYFEMLDVAKVHEILGDRDSALIFVRQAFANGAKPFIFEASGWLDDLRQDPAFADLASQYRTEEE
ncbi:MAG: tetratricopeptide repeat protein, partial [Rhodothermales bacterium]|nr:tetratricopeptide repeat protein [Rhodothermales bacterium]